MSPNQWRPQVESYGGQDDTNPSSGGCHKRLHYFPDAAPAGAREQKVYKLPLHVEYFDHVGLPSPENYFLKYRLAPIAGVQFDRKDVCHWNSRVVTVLPPADKSVCYSFSDVVEATPPLQRYKPYSDFAAPVVDNAAGYYPSDIPPFDAKTLLIPDKVYVRVIDVGTDNRYNDVHFNPRLYRSDWDAVQGNEALFNHGDTFYVGFHSRNSRPVDFRVMVQIWPVVDQSHMPLHYWSHTESLYDAYPPNDYEFVRDPKANEIYEHVLDIVDRNAIPEDLSPLRYSIVYNDRPDFGQRFYEPHLDNP